MDSPEELLSKDDKEGATIDSFLQPAQNISDADARPINKERMFVLICLSSE